MNKFSKYVKTEDIREIRKAKGITVNEIVKRMGFSSRVSYYNIESGYVEPKISQMVMLSEILDEPIERIFNLSRT